MGAVCFSDGGGGRSGGSQLHGGRINKIELHRVRTGGGPPPTLPQLLETLLNMMTFLVILFLIKLFAQINVCS